MGKELKDYTVLTKYVYPLAIKNAEYLGDKCDDVKVKSIVCVLIEDDISKVKSFAKGEGVILTGEHAGKVMPYEVFSGKGLIRYENLMLSTLISTLTIQLEKDGNADSYEQRVSLGNFQLPKFSSLADICEYTGGDVATIGEVQRWTEEINKEYLNDTFADYGKQKYLQAREDMNELFGGK